MLVPRAISTAMVAIMLLVGSTARAKEAVPSSKNFEVLNVGSVVYNKTRSPGTLIARWNYGNRFGGPGLATGGPAEGFEGDFHVRYFNDDGSFSDEYDLKIVKTGSSFDVSWLVRGVVQARGVGMLVEEGNALAVGWRRIDK